MTNQMQGEILYAGWAGTSAEKWAYTPWMPVHGDVATFGVEVMVVSGVTLTWGVQTRTKESSVTAECLDDTSLPTIAAVGVSVQTNDGASDSSTKELVRYKFKTGATASTTDFVIVRALPPTWNIDR